MSEDIPSGTSNYKIETVDLSKGVYFLNPSAGKVCQHKNWLLSKKYFPVKFSNSKGMAKVIPFVLFMILLLKRKLKRIL